jgi:predicted GNAT family acetyltransferase
MSEGQGRKRDLEQKVLAHVKKNGTLPLQRPLCSFRPEASDKLYSRFTLMSDVFVAPVLQELRHIEVTNHGK